MKIVEATEFFSSHKTGQIVGLTKAEIDKRLGVIAGPGDGDGKVKYEWNLEVTDGNVVYEVAIWEWKGGGAFKEHSTYGNPTILRKIFGNHWMPY